MIGDHDVLIEVRAAGLDRGTEHLMTGKPYAKALARHAVEVDELIAELRETHRRRPALQQEFDRAGLPWTRWRQNRPS